MKLIFNDKSNLGGIYKILNLANGRVYIGSSASFYKRAYSHLHNLEMNRHLNTFLQNDFNKCGTDNFIFEVLEVMEGDKEVRLAREQFFIDQHYDNQKQCYNLARLAMDSRSGTRNKKLFDRATDGRCKSPSKEVLAKRSLALKNVYKNKPSLKEVCAINARKKWQGHDVTLKLVNVRTGEKVVVSGSLRAWCLDRGLNYKAMHLVKQKKTKVSCGWRLSL